MTAIAIDAPMDLGTITDNKGSTPKSTITMLNEIGDFAGIKFKNKPLVLEEYGVFPDDFQFKAIAA